MEDLFKLVSASFARHGVECPPADTASAWGRPTVQPGPDRTSTVDTDPAIQSERAAARERVIQPAPSLRAQFAGIYAPAASLAGWGSSAFEPSLPTALPEHGYRKKPEGDPAP